MCERQGEDGLEGAVCTCTVCVYCMYVRLDACVLCMIVCVYEFRCRLYIAAPVL